jgi:hypothetical protein
MTLSEVRQIAGTCNALVFNAVAPGMHHRSMVSPDHAMV